MVKDMPTFKDLPSMTTEDAIVAARCLYHRWVMGLVRPTAEDAEYILRALMNADQDESEDVSEELEEVEHKNNELTEVLEQVKDNLEDATITLREIQDTAGFEDLDLQANDGSTIQDVEHALISCTNLIGDAL